MSLQRRINLELCDSVAQFRALIDSSVDHIFMLDENETYVFSNDNVSHLGLNTGRELVGRRLEEVYPRDACALYREKASEVFAKGRGVAFVHDQKTANGIQHHQDTLFPIFRDDRIWALGGICRDLSEQKEIEKQLFQAQKMEALGTLVAGAAHEINNPINLLQFNLPLFEKMWRDLMPMLDALSEHLQDKKFGGLSYDFIKQNMLRLISDMEMAINRVGRIVSGLKQFSRKNNPADKADIDVNTAVENATRLAASTLSKSKTRLELALTPRLPLLHANLQNLEQIVLNLLINAFQSIDHDHGKVKITTGWQTERQAITIDIEDNGRGISPRVVERIFDPFVTDRQAQGGTGLGLSVTYNLVKAHNGEIAFDAKPGGGTRFTITLPALDQRNPKRIMVVDDDASFRTLLIKILSKKTDCITEGFSNGAEALIRLGSSPPDILILDMFMPEMDGLGVCRAIKNELGIEMTRVLIVTGYPQHPSLNAARRLGFEQIFYKPLEMNKLIKIIQEEFDEYHT